MTDPLMLEVVLTLDQIKLISAEIPYPGVITRNETRDAQSVADALAKVLQKRKEQHVYKPGAEARTDLPEDDRIARSVVIKAWRACSYSSVINLIDAVKTGANPIILQVDDLP